MDHASRRATAATSSTVLSEWPGERSLEQWDVQEPVQLPAASLRDRFRAALLSSDHALHCHSYLSSESCLGGFGACAPDDPQPLPYPLCSLLTLPDMPNDEILLQSLASFNATFKKHLFLEKWALHSSMEGSVVPPYLQLAFACLACALTFGPDAAQDPSDHVLSSTEHSAARLCRSGITLWRVMLEVDNREARLVEAVLAVREPRILSISSPHS